MATAKADGALLGAACARLDVRDDAAVNTVVGALPGLDVLVNCAGVLRRGAELDPR